MDWVRVDEPEDNLPAAEDGSPEPEKDGISIAGNGGNEDAWQTGMSPATLKQPWISRPSPDLGKTPNAERSIQALSPNTKNPKQTGG